LLDHVPFTTGPKGVRIQMSHRRVVTGTTRLDHNNSKEQQLFHTDSITQKSSNSKAFGNTAKYEDEP
jgi:hypothetical protein